MRALSRLAIAALLWGTCSTATAQDAGVELGILTCTLEAARDARPADEGTEGGQTRDALCSFKPETGAEETYSARVRGVSVSADPTITILWLVKGRSQTPLAAGFLQQSYAADPKPPPDSGATAIIGEVNSDLMLHPMADKQQGDASDAKGPKAIGFVVTGVELKLKSTSG